ncbi:hypothetical protein SCHPADRAFT_349560 [Schizopora paradoxa]|uniref:Uncharacterized protein n=1 Tax=Schizopora paradoxa TaxID=27342 RepID=A0A0H2RQ07_9AGAM|nr:hypothetical protein SCHPADRAFT_349560 [Schizopora paradoxa]
MLYVFCLLALSAGNMVFLTVHSGSLYWMLITEAQRIGHTILASRLVLNMRSCADRSCEGSIPTIATGVNMVPIRPRGQTSE